MFSSTVIPTIARPSLTRAVESVLAQRSAATDFEIIVVNDSGQPLSNMAWQHLPNVQVIETSRREKSAARNAGAAIACGKFLHFLDDDDCLLPGALARFRELTRRQQAVWYYGGALLVDRQGRPLQELCHDLAGNCFIQLLAGEWIPMGASLIDSDAFFSVGGLNPLMPVAEDVDLARRLAMRGDFAGIPDLVLEIGVGQQGSSVDYALLPAFSRKAREAILDDAGVFTRMRQSADDAYWHGRICRAYVTSMIWNGKQRRLFTVLSRAVFAALGLATARRTLFAARFWRAFAGSHQSVAFARGQAKAASIEMPQAEQITS